MVKIDQGDWDRIQELKKRQDYHVFSLGVLEASFLQARAKLLDVADKPNLEQFGALEWEHYQQQVYWFEKIKDTEETQRQAGEGALRNIGIDASRDMFSIDDAVVFILQQGQWVPFERKVDNT